MSTPLCALREGLTNQVADWMAFPTKAPTVRLLEWIGSNIEVFRLFQVLKSYLRDFQPYHWNLTSEKHVGTSLWGVQFVHFKLNYRVPTEV